MYKGHYCGDPGKVRKATRIGSSYLYGDKVTYVCDDGYEITMGEAQRTCDGDSKWNGTKPVCSGRYIFNLI